MTDLLSEDEFKATSLDEMRFDRNVVAWVIALLSGLAVFWMLADLSDPAAIRMVGWYSVAIGALCGISLSAWTMHQERIRIELRAHRLFTADPTLVQPPPNESYSLRAIGTIPLGKGKVLAGMLYAGPEGVVFAPHIEGQHHSLPPASPGTTAIYLGPLQDLVFCSVRLPPRLFRRNVTWLMIFGRDGQIDFRIPRPELVGERLAKALIPFGWIGSTRGAVAT